jgi:quercetin dioxygenase-like cupin family protein
MSAYDLASRPIHLGLGASAEVEPEFTGDMQWYRDYEDRHTADGAEGRIVGIHTFTESWGMWEMHPAGCEVVLCTAGTMTLLQELPDGQVQKTTLNPGQYAINAPGVWHTADIESEATAIFITAGMGTEHRPR